MIPAVTNHLWQSTLFAALAGLLTLALRKNRAQTRYWVWMAASMKFAVPFAFLVMLGGHLSWRAAPAMVRPNLAVAIADTARSFVAPVVAATPAAARGGGPDPLRTIVFVWACGVLAVLGHWLVRWLRVRAVVRSATPLDFEFPVPVRTSNSLIEPGVFGILRPVLLLPQGMRERLTPEQLRAILIHEATHIRRRDNLTGFLHMLVAAFFWFHPLVWWIGARLVDERERACDEEVLRDGSEPEVYAEGILNICKLYVESPLVCVSGVTGANLKKRIEAIMTNQRSESLNRARKAMIAAAGVAAIALPLAVGIVHAPLMRAQEVDWQTAAGGKMAFEVASVKLDTGQFRPPKFPLDTGNAYTPTSQFSADFPVLTYIHFAYKVDFTQQQRESMLARLPKWIDSDRFAIEARTNGIPTKDQMRLMMQSLLADRFQLKVHFETQETAVFALTLAKAGKPGPKLRPHSEGPPCDDPEAAPEKGAKADTGVFPDRCEVQALIVRGRQMMAGSRNTTMDQLAEVLSGLGRLGRPMVDRTGITGRIDYRMDFRGEPDPMAPPDANAPPDPGPTFMEALHEQLGLKLEPAKAQLRVLVIDRVERPSEN